jgi:hypothetical protein
MAKKRRSTATDTMGQAMQVIFNTASRLAEPPPPNMMGMSNRLFLAGDKLMAGLRRRGIDCKCRHTYPKTGFKYVCSCAARKRRR